MIPEIGEMPVPEPVRLSNVGPTAPPVDWLWQGYLARGSATLLTSLWKTGKTTLLSVLLSRLREGGLFADRPLAAGRAAVVSEEPLGFWQERGQRLGLAEHVYFWCRPFRDLPTREQWQHLIQSIARLHEQARLDLVVIDPLATFLPMGAEAFAGNAMHALLPLQQLTDAGLSVLLLHHPRKGEPPLGQAARGSGAFAGFADILIEMKSMGRPDSCDRRRRLVAFSRHEATPRDLIIELNAEATDYLARGDLADEEFSGYWPTLHRLLTDTDYKLTRQGILSQWPPPDAKPNDTYLYRLLERAVERKLLARESDGRRNHPFQYWLPDRIIKRGFPPLERLEGVAMEYQAPVGKMGK